MAAAIVCPPRGAQHAAATRRRSAGRLVTSAALALACAPAFAAAPMPAAVGHLIQTVHRAAVSRDFDQLRQTMTADFQWSFDAAEQTADRALRNFQDQTDTWTLPALAAATANAQACGYVNDNVECPRDAGSGYRAGFARTTAGWRMIYFVAGE